VCVRESGSRSAGGGREQGGPACPAVVALFLPSPTFSTAHPGRTPSWASVTRTAAADMGSEPQRERAEKSFFLAELVVLPKCVFFFVQNRFLLLSPHRAQRLCLCLLTHAHTPPPSVCAAPRHPPRTRLLPCSENFFCRLPSVATPRSHARPLNREQRSFAQSHCWRGERHAKTRQACEHTRTRASDRFLFLRCTPRADGVSHVQPPHAVVVHA
jgi:hypothetical protein